MELSRVEGKHSGPSIVTPWDLGFPSFSALTEPRRGALGSVSALESEAGTVRSLLSILQVLNQEQRHHRHLSKLGNNLNQMCAEVHMERDLAQSTVYQEYV